MAENVCEQIKTAAAANTGVTHVTRYASWHTTGGVIWLELMSYYQLGTEVILNPRSTCSCAYL